MISDSEIAARNPRGADESEEQWIARCKRVKAELLVQSAIGDEIDEEPSNG